MRLKRVLSLSLLSGFFMPAAMAVAPNPVSWQFLAGDYGTAYDQDGMDLNLDVLPRKTFSDRFWNRLSAALPERQDLRTTHPEHITDDAGATVRLRESGEVFLTFLHEGAGYRNSLGYFTFDPDNPPRRMEDIQEKIVFPNVSFQYSGGGSRGLQSGQTLKLGSFPAGTAIGFVLVANGHDPATGVKTNPDRDWIFTTLKDLNAETDPELRAHTVLLYDEEDQQVVLGLEDTLRTLGACDHDFNDVMFSITSNPPSAIRPDNLTTLSTEEDRDRDGVKDSLDAFPEDASRSFVQNYPENGGYHTLAFEDNWPAQGDYDMNDLVVQYRYEQVLDSRGFIKDIHGYYQVKARGAELHNAFSLEIPGTRPADLASAHITRGNQRQSVSPETEQEYLVFPVIEDATRFTEAPGCAFFNTLPHCLNNDPAEIKLELSFQQALDPFQVGQPPYNPFLFRTDQRGMEVHLPNHLPTRKASTAHFGTRDDASDPARGQYYKTRDHLPWALNIPSAWEHPVEHQSISRTYLDFARWVESAGQSHNNWYTTNTHTPYLFRAQANQ